MGVPVIPCVEQRQALTNLLESIALEETALAHVVNAEGEKIQAMACQMTKACPPNNCDVLAFQKSVVNVIQTAIKMQILLQFKLENVLEAKVKLECCEPCQPNPCPPQPCPQPNCPPQPCPSPQPCPPQTCPAPPHCVPQPCPSPCHNSCSPHQCHRSEDC